MAVAAIARILLGAAIKGLRKTRKTKAAKTEVSQARKEKVQQAAKEVTKLKRQNRTIKGSRVNYPSPNKPAGGRTKVVSDAAARVRARNEKLEKLGKSWESPGTSRKS